MAAHTCTASTGIADSRDRKRISRRITITAVLVCVVLPAGLPLVAALKIFRTEVLDRRLVIAVNRTNAVAVDELLKQGANPNASVTFSDPSFSHTVKLVCAAAFAKPSLASQSKRKSVLDLVLDRAWDFNISNGVLMGYHRDDRLKPYDDVAYALLKKGARTVGEGRVSDVVDMAAMCHLDRALEFELEHGAPANVENGANPTPLEGADEEGTRILLRHGANVNTWDKFRLTPLMLANTPSQTMDLLKAGADVSAQNRHGDTALSIDIRVLRSMRTRPDDPQWRCFGTPSEMAQIVRLLKEASGGR